jgi:transcriptional regulator with XRE-family HTH domain
MYIVRNIMPAKLTHTSSTVAERIQILGGTIRAQRKNLHISAQATADCAHISRVTLHRIEKGEPSVTMGAYFTVLDALGLQIQTKSKAGLGEESQAGPNTSVIPSEIKLTEYPQLKQLAWHIHGLDALTPIEAFGIYDRNWRHLDATSLTPLEKSLIDALKRADAAGEL